MTLYAILHKPIGGIFGWAIPDDIAATSPVMNQALIWRDMFAYGVGITDEHGKHLPLTDAYPWLSPDFPRPPPAPPGQASDWHSSSYAHVTRNDPRSYTAVMPKLNNPPYRKQTR